MNCVYDFPAALPACEMWQGIIEAPLIESKPGLGEL